MFQVLKYFKYSIPLTLMGVTFLMGQIVEAGQEGHGGGTFVCKDERGKPLIAYSQDLWNAEKVELRTLKDFGTMSEEQIARSVILPLNDWDPKFYNKVSQELNRLLAKKSANLRDVKIPRTGDPDPIFELFSCDEGSPDFLQAAIYLADGRIFFSKPVDDVMVNNTHRAAVDVHEAIYKVYRGWPYKVKDSSSTQAMVGVLFSTDGSLDNISPALPRACVTNPRNGICEQRVRIIWEGKGWWGITPNRPGVRRALYSSDNFPLQGMLVDEMIQQGGTSEFYFNSVPKITRFEIWIGNILLLRGGVGLSFLVLE